MPSFDNIDATVSIDFEVYCTCGEGICSLATVRTSRSRGYPQIVMEPCPKCIERETDPLKDQIRELESRLEELEAQSHHIP